MTSSGPLSTSLRTISPTIDPNASSDYPPDGYLRLTESANQLRTVNELAVALLKPSTLIEVLWVVARTTISQLGFEDCVIYLVDEHRAVLVQKAAYGPKNPVAEEILDPIEIAVGQGIVGSVASTGQAERVCDTRLDSRYILDDEMRLSELAVPIVHQGTIIGVIDSEHPSPNFYTASHLEVMVTIASMASTKIASALTIERLNAAVAQLGATQQALRDGELRYRMLYEQHPSMFFTLDIDGTILSANQFAASRLGFPIEALVGVPLMSLSPETARESIVNGLAQCVDGPGQVHRWESCRLKQDGTQLWVRETGHLVSLPDSNGPAILVVSEDITDTYNLARDLKYQASHDALTGLYNRREFESRMQQALDGAKATGAEHAICYLDLDQFKVINDTAGHLAGDELLRQLAVAFKDRMRKTDVIARLGGDEFGVLVQRCTVEQATTLAQSLLEVVGASRFHWEGRLFRYGVSIGVVPISAASSDLSGILSAADAACYAAKEAGRNRVHVYSADDEELLKRHAEMGWAVRLSEAIEHDQFELYYQPIRAVAPTATGTTKSIRPASISIEVLLRLVPPSGPVIGPDIFLPAAERYGMGTELDRWVVGHTLAWLNEHASQLDDIDVCSLNISGTSLGDAQFAEFTINAVQSCAIDPQRICFEITETAAIAHLFNAQTFIKALQALGCRFALDDFGSGFSSFAYLKNLSVDFLKIDGTFIKNLVDDPVDREMVRSINEIAHMMGKKTVAEFVQSEAAFETLRVIGVDFAQGQFIGAAQPLARLFPT
ncbi:MAG: EAL domain-containing protein [Chromatiales bacterium]|nr:EAL domain-containing protein [Chromatiales bacterium]